jgi:hypothetical protein
VVAVDKYIWRLQTRRCGTDGGGWDRRIVNVLSYRCLGSKYRRIVSDRRIGIVVLSRIVVVVSSRSIVAYCRRIVVVVVLLLSFD